MKREGLLAAGPHETSTGSGRVHDGLQGGTFERRWKGLHFLVLDEAGVSIGDDGLVRVPSRGRDGTVLREHYFRPDGRTWWSKGDGLSLFGLECIPEPEVAAKSALVILEGESSTLAFRESFADVVRDGREPISYVALGVPGAATWRPEWSLVADPFSRVYLVPDSDPAGRIMAKAALADIPWARLVTLAEGDDPRDVLQRDGARALDPLLDQADRDAELHAPFVVAKTLGELESLLLDEEVADAA